MSLNEHCAFERDACVPIVRLSLDACGCESDAHDRCHSLYPSDLDFVVVCACPSKDRFAVLGFVRRVVQYRNKTGPQLIATNTTSPSTTVATGPTPPRPLMDIIGPGVCESGSSGC